MRVLAIVRIAAFVVPCVCLVSLASGQDSGVGSGGAPSSWMQAHRAIADQQLEYLREAYQLDEALVKKTRSELEQRLASQWEFDLASTEELSGLAPKQSGGTTEIADATAERILQKLEEISETMPLNEVAVADWLESQLSRDGAAKGRANLKKLWRRREQQRAAKERGARERAGRKVRLAKARNQQRAASSVIGNPQPHRPLRASSPIANARRADDSENRMLSTGRSHGTRGKASAGGGLGASNKSKVIALPAAPPLDDWDKHVDRTAARYGFTDDQRTKAQAILRDLRRRAEQYQLSRADDFRALERIEDAKARSKKEQTLAAPLNAMFDELKQRLDGLATLEQRAKAGETSKHQKVKKSKPKS